MTVVSSLPSSKQARRLYPSNLELFQQCRRRFHLKVVERRSFDQPFSPALAKGNIAHDVLKLCGREWMESASMPADLRSMVATRLPRVQYPSEDTWEHDVTEIVSWVKYGLAYLDPWATILGVEQFQNRTFQPDESSPIPLGVVIDLLLLRTDSTGAQFIEIIDYKCGKNLDASMFAPVMTRFVLKRLLTQHLPGEGFAKVIFTELYLSKQHVRTREMTQERCLADWEDVKKTLAAISNESSWTPTPSPLCEWCPFNSNGCEPMLEDTSLDLW